MVLRFVYAAGVSAGLLIGEITSRISDEDASNGVITFTACMVVFYSSLIILFKQMNRD